MTTPFPRTVLAGLLILPLLLGGCASQTRMAARILQRPAPTDRAEATFAYLKYLEHLKQEELEAAQETLSKAASLDPSPALFAEQGLFHSRYRDDPERGLEIIQQGLERFPDSRSLVLSAVDLALQLERSQAAIEQLEGYLQANPEDVRAATRLAGLYLQEAMDSQALDLLKGIPEPERSAEVHYRLAQAYASLGEHGKAIDHLRTATERSPGMLKAWAELAYQYETTKDFVAAQETYAKLLEMGVDNPDIRLRLIELQLKLNNPGKALEQAQALPGDEKALIRAAGLFVQNDFFQEAETLLNGLEAESLSDRARYLRALIAFRGQEDHEAALEILEGIDQGSSLHSDSLSLQCRILLGLDRLQEARRKARRGQSIYPEKADFWLLESDILRSEERYQEAREVLLEAREHLPEDTSILFQLGFLEHEMGRPDKALEFMERIIRINPDHAEALNFVGYTLTEESRDLDRARILIKKALEMEPENGYFLDSLAWLYFKTDKLDKAWEVMRRAVGIEQQDPVMWEHYGDIARALNKLDEARRAYKRALDLDPPDPEAVERKLEALPKAQDVL